MIITINGKKILNIQMNKIKFDIKWTVFLFILIFGPPFMPYPHIFLSLISLLFLLLLYKSDYNKLYCLARTSGIHKWIFTMIVLFFYVCIVAFPVSALNDDIVNLSHYISIINRYGVLCLTVVSCDLLIIYVIKKRNISWNRFVEMLVYAGLLESFCCVASYVSPTVKEFFVSSMVRFIGGFEASNWYITVRCYGFASTLVDLFGFGIALIAGVSFFYGVEYKPRFVLYSVLIAFDALINARTGVVIYVMAIVITIAYWAYKGNLKLLSKILVSLGIIIFLVVLVWNIVSTNETSFYWIDSALESIKSLLSNKNLNSNTGKMDPLVALFEEQSWALPDGIRIILGTGHSLYLANGYKHSDIGYINEIWLWGIIGCALLYGTLIKIAKNLLRKSNPSIFKFTAIYTISAFIVFNIKGIALGYNPGAVVMLLLIFVFTWYSNNEYEGIG
nr:hypothetical protein [uncultured Agathobacter sp.]